MSKVKHVCVSVVVCGALLAGIPRAEAQNEQQESIADAARRSREQKKETTKPSTVITNDTLEPPKTEAPSAAAAASAQPAPAATATTETGMTTAATGGAQAAGPAPTPVPSAELEALKQEIKQLQSEVDLAQRELALANEDFYSRPDFSKDEAGKAKLDAMKSDVAQKVDELAKLKAQLPAGANFKEEKPAQSESQSHSPSQPSPPESQTEQQTTSQPAPQQR
jgi:hypothetical protein